MGFRNWVIVFGALCVALVVATGRHKQTEPTVRLPQLAYSLEGGAIKNALEWYANNALGALKPPGVLQVDFSDKEDRLASLLKEQGIVSASGSLKNSIASEYRSHLWWPGRPASDTTFQLSPFSYQVKSVDEIVPGENGVADYADVSFTLQVSGASDLGELLARNNISSKTNAVVGGVKLKVRFMKAESAYYLPLTREPLM